MDRVRQQRDTDPNDHTTDEEIMSQILKSGRSYTKGIGPKLPAKVLLYTRGDGAFMPTHENSSFMIDGLRKVASNVEKIVAYLKSIDPNFLFERTDIESTSPQHPLGDNDEEDDD